MLLIYLKGLMHLFFVNPLPYGPFPVDKGMNKIDAVLCKGIANGSVTVSWFVVMRIFFPKKEAFIDAALSLILDLSICQLSLPCFYSI